MRLTLPSPRPWLPLLILSVLALACGRKDESAPNRTSKTAAALSPDPARTLPETPPARLDAASGLILIPGEASASGLELELRVPADRPLPSQPAGFNLTLPADAQPSIELTAWQPAGNGPPIRFDAQASTQTTQIGTQVIAQLELSPASYVGQFAVRRLTVRPSAWNSIQRLDSRQPSGGTLRFRARWPERSAPASPVALHRLRAVAEALVANPADLDRFSALAPPPAAPGLGALTDPRLNSASKAAQRWARTLVSADGLYRVPASMLAEAGLTSGGQMTDVRAFSQGKPVALLAKGDSLYFHGWASRDREGRGRAYWFTCDAATTATAWPAAAALPELNIGATSASRPLESVQRTALLDVDNERKLMQDNLLSIRGIEWVDTEVVTTTPLTLPLTLIQPLRTQGEGDAPATVAALLHFFNAGPPETYQGTQLSLREGDREITSITIGGEPEQAITVTLPISAFNEDGAATFTLHVTRDTSATLSDEDEGAIWFDRFEAKYIGAPALDGDGRLLLDADSLTSPGRYRVALSAARGGAQPLLALELNPQEETEALLPVHAAEDGAEIEAVRTESWQSEIFALSAAPTTTLTQVTFDDALLMNDVKQGAKPIDYLVLSYGPFIDQLTSLTTINERRGLTTRIVPVESVYDYFGHGRLSTEAIRSYLYYLLRELSDKAPVTVLLVGDATSDFLDLTRSGLVNQMPTHSYVNGSDNWASDYWYSCAAGQDHLADFLIGRLPANNPEDLAAMLAKLATQLEAPELGPWRAQLGSVTDNVEGFREAAETLRQGPTPAAFGTRRIHLDTLPLEDNWYIPVQHIERLWAEEKSWMKVSGAATTSIRDLFDGQAGWIDFWGHGSPNIWTDERIWFGGDSPNRDSQSLRPSRRLPVVVNFTCNTGAVDYPVQPWNICISEDLLRARGAGAAALLVPSGPGVTSTHEQFAKELWGVLFGDNLRALGEVSALARARWTLGGGALDMTYMYMLLGDPLLRIPVAQRWHQARLASPTLSPAGGPVRVSVADLALRSGQHVTWIEDARGEHIAELPAASYSGGSMEAELTLPAGLKHPSDYTVRVYGWSDDEGGDWAAAAPLRVSYPGPNLASGKIDLDGGTLRLKSMVENPSPVAGGNAMLRLMEHAADDAPREIAHQTVDLAAASSETVTLEIPASPASAQPRWFTLALELPSPPDDMTRPQIQQMPLAWIPPGWMGFAAAQSSRLGNPTQGDAQVQVVVLSSAPTTAPLQVQWQVGEVRSPAQTLTLQPAGNLWRAEMRVVRPGDASTSAPQRIVLLTGDGVSTTAQRTELDQLDPEALKGEWPALKIVPGSIRHQPENPTDGQTILITCDVINEGTAPSTETRPVLLDDSPTSGGQQLPLQGTGQAPLLPALAPGRTVPLTLRWDPIRNAGVQQVWIDLRGQASPTDAARAGQIASYRLFVRTKHNLQRLRTWASRSAEDQRQDRYRLHCEVGNSGETEARAVEVTFFAGTEHSPDNRIGRVMLDVLEPRGKAEAVLVWQVPPELKAAVDSGELRPTVEIRLKGSSQRIIEH